MSLHEVIPFKGPKRASFAIPGSKSYTNRALVMASLTDGSITLYNPLYSEDTQVMINCLRTLGIAIETFADKIIVHGDITAVKEGRYELFVKDSGTSARFLLALACIIPGIKVLGGNKRLNERPIADLIEALKILGADIIYLEAYGQLPIKIVSSKLALGSKVRLNASQSSQFVSALLMIAPLLEGLNIGFLGEIISKAYVEMTSEMMAEWGICVKKQADGSYYVPPGQRYCKKNYMIEGDFSSAGYFLAIAALTGSTFTLQNLQTPTAQADYQFLKILEMMGHEMEITTQQITITGKELIPLDVNMEGCPDQVQTLAVMAAFVDGVTTITGIRSLRLKETERVQALKAELLKMGIKTEDTFDSIKIYGGKPKAAVIETYNDHRMAMAFAVAGTKLSGVKIMRPEVVAKTVPHFWDMLGSL